MERFEVRNLQSDLPIGKCLDLDRPNGRLDLSDFSGSYAIDVMPPSNFVVGGAKVLHRCSALLHLGANAHPMVRRVGSGALPGMPLTGESLSRSGTA